MNKTVLGLFYYDQGLIALPVSRQGKQIDYGRPIHLLARQDSGETVNEKPIPPALPEADSAESDKDSTQPKTYDLFSKNPLAEKLRQKLTAQQGREKYPPVAMALAGSLYQQVSHHTEFTQTKLLDQVLRYDLEEDFAQDADQMIVCYQQCRVDETGSDLLVYSLPRQQLKNILHPFEQAKLEPLIVEPDIAAWQHYLRCQESLPADKPSLILGYTAGTLYLLVLSAGHKVQLARSFICSDRKHIDQLLEMELSRSLAYLPPESSVGCLYYHSQELDTKKIEQLAKRHELPARELREKDPAIAFAAGAALSELGADSSEPPVDFRRDNLSSRTLLRSEKNAYVLLAGAVSLLLLVWIGVMHFHTQKNLRLQRIAKEDITSAWKIVFPDVALPRQELNIIPKKVHTRLQDVKRRYSDAAQQVLSESAANTLRLVFEAINVLGEDFDIQIDHLSCSTESATFSGSVADMESLIALREVFQTPAGPLEIGSINFTQSGGQSPEDPAQRRSFSMQLKVKPMAKPRTSGS